LRHHYTFVGGTLGPREVARMTLVRGEGLDPAARLELRDAAEIYPRYDLR